jgi:tetratricopeptide (TPR) repeat protein
MLSFISCHSLEKSFEKSAKMKEARKNFKKKEYDKALLAYEKILAHNPKDEKALEGATETFVSLGRYYDAIHYAQKMKEISPECSRCDFFLGESYRALGKSSVAVEHYRKALEKRPMNIQILKSLSWALYIEEEFEEGYSLIEKVYRRSPFDPDTAIIRIRFLLQLKNFKDALTASHYALSRVKKTELKAQLYSFKGDIYTSFLQIEKAKNYYEKALFLEPLLGGALFGLGRVYYSMEEKAKAKEYLTRSIRVSEKFTDAYYYLAKIYELEDKRKAKIFYEKFYKKAHSNEKFLGLALEAKKKIEALR